jgi:hypothetical protein
MVYLAILANRGGGMPNRTVHLADCLRDMSTRTVDLADCRQASFNCIDYLADLQGRQLHRTGPSVDPDDLGKYLGLQVPVEGLKTFYMPRYFLRINNIPHHKYCISQLGTLASCHRCPNETRGGELLKLV